MSDHYVDYLADQSPVFIVAGAFSGFPDVGDVFADLLYYVDSEMADAQPGDVQPAIVFSTRAAQFTELCVLTIEQLAADKERQREMFNTWITSAAYIMARAYQKVGPERAELREAILANIREPKSLDFMEQVESLRRTPEVGLFAREAAQVYIYTFDIAGMPAETRAGYVQMALGGVELREVRLPRLPGPDVNDHGDRKVAVARAALIDDPNASHALFARLTSKQEAPGDLAIARTLEWESIPENAPVDDIKAAQARALTRSDTLLLDAATLAEFAAAGNDPEKRARLNQYRDTINYARSVTALPPMPPQRVPADLARPPEVDAEWLMTIYRALEEAFVEQLFAVASEARANALIRAADPADVTGVMRQRPLDARAQADSLQALVNSIIGRYGDEQRGQSVLGAVQGLFPFGQAPLVHRDDPQFNLWLQTMNNHAATLAAVEMPDLQSIGSSIVPVRKPAPATKIGAPIAAAQKPAAPIAGSAVSAFLDDSPPASPRPVARATPIAGSAVSAFSDDD